MNTQILIIDPQNDFCNPKGALYVPGAEDDIKRLSKFIRDHIKEIDDIHCTIDCHQTIHIAHGICWLNSKGEHPKPFTIISVDDVKNGTWRAFNPKWQTRFANYVETLASSNRYPHCIWPEHCLIGTWGHGFVPEIADAFHTWETNSFARVNYVPKGNNPFTEHFSGVKAEVPDNSDPTTKLNTDLLDVLQQADQIYITGQALTHCVANTCIDIADNFGEENVKKFILLEDTTSGIPGFEQQKTDFIKGMVKRGMKIAKTTDI